MPGYPPLLNDSDSVTAVCPIYYGLLLFQQAGAGPILQTAVSPGALNITAYALTTSPGVFSVVALNKEPAASIELQIQLPQAVTHASLTQMTQLSPGASAPDLLATSGVTIQSSTVQTDGAFAPGASYQLSPNGTQVTCFIPALSAGPYPGVLSSLLPHLVIRRYVRRQCNAGASELYKAHVRRLPNEGYRDQKHRVRVAARYRKEPK